MTALSKSNARTYGVDFAGAFVDIVDDLTDWLATVRPHMSEDEIDERADRLAHAWAE
jgi:hypothetical protein